MNSVHKEAPPIQFPPVVVIGLVAVFDMMILAGLVAATHLLGPAAEWVPYVESILKMYFVPPVAGAMVIGLIVLVGLPSPRLESMIWHRVALVVALGWILLGLWVFITIDAYLSESGRLTTFLLGPGVFGCVWVCRVLVAGIAFRTKTR